MFKNTKETKINFKFISKLKFFISSKKIIINTIFEFKINK